MLPEAVWRQINPHNWQFHQPGYAVLGTVTHSPIHPDEPAWCWSARVMDDCRADRVQGSFDGKPVPFNMPFFGRAHSFEGARRIVEVLLTETNTYPR